MAWIKAMGGTKAEVKESGLFLKLTTSESAVGNVEKTITQKGKYLFAFTHTIYASTFSLYVNNTLIETFSGSTNTLNNGYYNTFVRECDLEVGDVVKLSRRMTGADDKYLNVSIDYFVV